MSEPAIAAAEAVTANNQGNPVAVTIAAVICAVLFALILLGTAFQASDGNIFGPTPPKGNTLEAEAKSHVAKLEAEIKHLATKTYIHMRAQGNSRLLSYYAMIASPRWNGTRQLIVAFGFNCFVAGTWNLFALPFQKHGNSIVDPIYWVVCLALLYISGTLLNQGGVQGSYLPQVERSDTGTIIIRVISAFIGQRM
jgi:hypothetical protein